MDTPTVGFIGGGRIARIFLGGWKRAQQLPARVVIAEPDSASRQRLKTLFPTVETTTDTAAAAGQEVVFLATHPPAVSEALTKAANALRSPTLLVSLAPKFTIVRLTELLGGFNRIARCNPNAPSIVGQGVNPLVFG